MCLNEEKQQLLIQEARMLRIGTMDSDLQEVIDKQIQRFFNLSENEQKKHQLLTAKYPLEKHTKETYNCPITGHLKYKEDLAEDIKI